MSTTQNAAVFEFMEALIRSSQYPIEVNINGVPHFKFAGKELPKSAEHLLQAPARSRAEVNFYEIASFINYFKRFADSGSIITGKFDETGGSLKAFLDYHEPSEADVNGARWAQHVLKYTARVTPEWARWLRNSGQPLSQLAFAEFLEDNAADIVAPQNDNKAYTSAQMMNVATTLEARTEVAFDSQVRLDNGAVKLGYAEIVNAQARGDGGSITIPQYFYISIAPFVGSPAYLIKVRLRFRLEKGKVNFVYIVDRPHKIVEDVLRDVREKLKTECARDVLLGEVENVNRLA